jgi:hypothetical protein
MIDFPHDESLMICGLDPWPFATEECPSEYKIIEERLQSRLRVDHFRLPPDYRSPAPGVQNPRLRIPCVRFPLWHFCPYCGNMISLALYSGTQRCDGPHFAEGLSCHSKPQKKRAWLVPMRFIAACPKGHIRDFPWMEWVHRNGIALPGCRLRIRAGRSAGLGGIRIICTCDSSQTLAGSFDPKALDRIGIHCGGQRPWLGDNKDNIARCGLDLQILQRGASNIYFAQIISSIYLPLWGEQADRSIVDTLEDPTVWSIISQAAVHGKIDPSRCEIIARMRGLDTAKLRDAAQRKLDGVPDSDSDEEQSEEEYRQAEYAALKEARGAEHIDLFSSAINARKYMEPVSTHMDSVTLVHKLRETRAFAGFSRILPDESRSREERMAEMRLDDRINWLPANTVRGEGIFFRLDEDKLAHWSGYEGVHDRVEKLIFHYNNVRMQRGHVPIAIPPKFVLLHTLAHLLINQLSFDCGYGSSSLRERLYCDVEDNSYPMQGILIYTASGDSEGTMGGLVRQGNPRRLENTIIRALRTAEWCSSDPICMESTGQGPGSCNLAACHSCALLPETSCEGGNRLLDRALIVGTHNNPEIGFFSDFTGPFNLNRSQIVKAEG